MWLFDLLDYMHVITHEIGSTNLGEALLNSFTLLGTTIWWHKHGLWLVTIGIMNDWYHIVLTQPLGVIRNIFGAFIEKVCLVYIICAYMTYLQFDVVLGRENLKFDILS